jgi:pimeloyl-ACP methyl ester carboxylesterase
MAPRASWASMRISSSARPTDRRLTAGFSAAGQLVMATCVMAETWIILRQSQGACIYGLLAPAQVALMPPTGRFFSAGRALKCPRVKRLPCGLPGHHDRRVLRIDKHEVGGVRLAVRSWPCRDAAWPPVVLLPGTGATAGDWDVIAAKLCADRTVFAVDLRGHGDSGRRQPGLRQQAPGDPHPRGPVPRPQHRTAPRLPVSRPGTDASNAALREGRDR